MKVGQNVDYYRYKAGAARAKKPTILHAIIRRIAGTRIVIAVQGETRERLVAPENLKAR